MEPSMNNNALTSVAAADGNGNDDDVDGEEEKKDLGEGQTSCNETSAESSTTVAITSTQQQQQQHPSHVYLYSLDDITQIPPNTIIATYNNLRIIVSSLKVRGIHLLSIRPLCKIILKSKHSSKEIVAQQVIDAVMKVVCSGEYANVLPDYATAHPHNKEKVDNGIVMFIKLSTLKYGFAAQLPFYDRWKSMCKDQLKVPYGDGCLCVDLQYEDKSDTTSNKSTSSSTSSKTTESIDTSAEDNIYNGESTGGGGRGNRGQRDTRGNRGGRDGGTGRSGRDDGSATAFASASASASIITILKGSGQRETYGRDDGKSKGKNRATTTADDDDGGGGGGEYKGDSNGRRHDGGNDDDDMSPPKYTGR